MLKILRNRKTAKKIFIVLASIIIPAFAFWGAGSLIRSREQTAYAGRIFGKNISLLEFKDSLNAVRNQAFIRYGENFSEIEKSLNLEAVAWENLILLYEAKKRGIKAADEEVVEYIRSFPFFQRKGRFDNKVYTQILERVFHTQPRIFEEQVRQDLIRSRLFEEVTKDVTVSDEEIKEEYRKANEEISVNYIAAQPSDFAKGITPAEEEIKAFFAKNSLQFKQPASFNMDYIVSDSETKIKEMASRLNKRADMARIAKEAGLTVNETGFFGPTDPIPGIGWAPEILSLISKLKTGQYTPAVRADKNYYILRLKEIKEASVPDFEKIKNKVKEAFVKNEAAKLTEKKIKECLEKMKSLPQADSKALDFAKIALDCGLKSGTTSLFKYGSYIEGIGASDILWLAADELKENNFSGVITAPSGFYIIRIKERISVDQNKFASETEAFRLNLLLQKKQDAFLKFSGELKRRTQ